MEVNKFTCNYVIIVGEIKRSIETFYGNSWNFIPAICVHLRFGIFLLSDFPSYFSCKTSVALKIYSEIKITNKHGLHEIKVSIIFP